MPTITTSLYTVQRNELVQDECCTPCTPCTPLHLARVIVLKLPRHLQLHLALLNRGLRTHIHTKHTHANMPCEREVVAKRTCHYILHKWSVTDVMTSQLHDFTTSHLHNFTPSQLHNFNHKMATLQVASSSLYTNTYTCANTKRTQMNIN